MDSRKGYEERLPSEEAILGSLERYFGFLHSQINTLADPNFSKIIEMQNKGWYMKHSKEDLQGLIDDFVNIYGYIYKEGDRTGLATFIRGTTLEEVERLYQGKEIPAAISTTTEESIAKGFCEYGNAALMRVSPCKNLPYAYVEHLKGENSANEEEVLILPFSKVKGSRFVSEWQGYKYYNVTLEKQELPELTDEQITELRQQCIDEHEQFVSQLEEYEGVSREYDILCSRFGPHSDEIEEIYTKMMDLRRDILAYKAKIREMLKGLCRQREKDIDFQKEDEDKAIQEERKRNEEERIRKLQEGIEKFKERLSTDSEIIQSGAQSNTSSLIATIRKYRDMSEELGIKTFNSQDLENELQARTIRITEGLQQEHINQVPDIEYGLLQDAMPRYDEAKKLLEEMTELLESYDENSMLDLKMNLSQKIQGIICRTEQTRLEAERQVALSEKDTLLSRISGKTALNQAKIKNIDARINYAAKRRQTPTFNSVSAMLLKMYGCAYKFNGGNLTQEMIETEEAMRKIFPDMPDQTTLIEQALQDEVTGLPVAAKKGIFSWITNRQEAKRLNAESLHINEKTQNASVPTQKNFSVNSNLTTIYSKCNSILSRIQHLVSENYIEQEAQLEAEQTQ